MQTSSETWGGKAGEYLPAMAVRCADIGPNANQEVGHVAMPPADGVMQAGDSLVVRLAGVAHLRERFSVQFPSVPEPNVIR